MTVDNNTHLATCAPGKGHPFTLNVNLGGHVFREGGGSLDPGRYAFKIKDIILEDKGTREDGTPKQRNVHVIATSVEPVAYAGQTLHREFPAPYGAGAQWGFTNDLVASMLSGLGEEALAAARASAQVVGYTSE